MPGPGLCVSPKPQLPHLLARNEFSQQNRIPEICNVSLYSHVSPSQNVLLKSKKSNSVIGGGRGGRTP